MADISAIMSVFSTATGILKELRSIDKGIDEAEYKLKIAILAESIADMKLAIIELREEVSKKDKVIEEIKQFYEEKKQLSYHEGHYYTAGGDGKPSGFPYCPVCISDEVRIMTIRAKSGRMCFCPKCKIDLDITYFPWAKG